MNVSLSDGLALAAVTAIIEAKVLVDRVRIYIPGAVHVDPDTMKEVHDPDVVLWEGPGALLPDRNPDITLHLADQQFTPVGAAGRYKLLTPVSAPTATPQHRVTVLAGRDPDAAGRVWSVLGVERSSHPVVRTTWLGYETTANGGS
ncbi:DUF6093 family protein [Streptomyces sp. NPDC001828]|uniref:DUF6093 family protein n=1 Tax=Streptomyces sp. NPDC001828 TaxID=3364615 RepID=UPI0036830C36